MSAPLKHKRTSTRALHSPEPELIRVILVDDHEMIREGLRFFLKDDGQLEIAGEAGEGHQALELAAKVQPHVALVDISMPVMDGIELCRRLIAESPLIGIIILTNFIDSQVVEKCIQAGARGYVLKDIDPFRLREIVKTVARGGSVIDPRVLSQLAFKSAGDHGERTETNHDLSAQEINILTLISQGFSNKAIGEKLSLSENTIKGYVQAILAKVHAKNRAEATMIALRNGWIKC